MAKRKAISKKKRFEIFKRDKFTCQYCGSKSPDVVLEVDHINPVSKGGKDVILNLITSCFDCNRGKKDIKLSDLSVIEKSKKQLEEAQDRLEQIKMQAQWAIDLAKAGSAEFDAVNDVLSEYTGYTFNLTVKRKIINLCKKHGLQLVLQSIPKALEYTSAEAFDIKHISKQCYISSLPEGVSESKYCRGIYNQRFSLGYNDFCLIEKKALGLIEEVGKEKAIHIFKNYSEEDLNLTIGIKEG